MSDFDRDDARRRLEALRAKPAGSTPPIEQTRKYWTGSPVAVDGTLWTCVGGTTWFLRDSQWVKLD